MEIINRIRDKSAEFPLSLVYQSIPSAIRTAVNVLSTEYQEPAPFQNGVWHWRSIVVAGGMCAGGLGVIVSLFYPSLFLTITLVVTTAILFFSLYYVSRYEEQKRMIELLGEFSEGISTLEQGLNKLTGATTSLEATQQTFEINTMTLTALKTSFTTHLIRQEEQSKILEETIADLKKQRDTFQRDLDSFKQANEERLGMLTAIVSTVRTEEDRLAEKTRELSEITTMLALHEQLQEQLTEEVQRLELIRDQLNEKVQLLGIHVHNLSVLTNDQRRAMKHAEAVEQLQKQISNLNQQFDTKVLKKTSSTSN